MEKGFELSEASNTPVILELRIRACHMFGSFVAKDNVAAAHSAKNRLAPARFNYDRLSHPPATFRQEADKIDRRLPRHVVHRRQQAERAARPGDGDIGIIVQGGLFNVLNGRLALAGFSDIDGVGGRAHAGAQCRASAGAGGDRRLLRRQEGRARGGGRRARLHRAGDRPDPAQGRPADETPRQGRAAHGRRVHAPGRRQRAWRRSSRRNGRPATALEQWIAEVEAQRAEVDKALGAPLPARPPTFCTGCPERPVFSAMKLLRKEMGPVHVSADIGCHSFATFAPFSQGNSILGYGMSLASAAAVSGTQANRPISVMGDGGFWHNGLITGVAGAVFNKDDSVLVVMNNGYSSATGQQDILSSREDDRRSRQEPRHRGGLAEHGRAVDQARAHLWRGRCRQYAARRPEHQRKGPESHHRRRRVPARTPATYPAGECAQGGCRRTRGAHAASGSTPRCARATTPAFACPAVPRSPSRPTRIRCARTPSPTSTTTAWAAGCAGRWRTRRSSARRSRRSTSSRTRLGGTDCSGAHPARSCGCSEAAGGSRRHRRHQRSCRRSETVADARRISVLIAALGGEGGGVLASWLHRSAITAGHFVQGTSIPGVAQRTGATTYYLEIVPDAAARHGASGARPVLALNAAPGEVDLVVASELLEATRAVAAGFVTPDRTTSGRIIRPGIHDRRESRHGRRPARQRAHDGSGATLLAPRRLRRFRCPGERGHGTAQRRTAGAIAGSGALPIPHDAFRSAIRTEAKSVDANLRGFEAGLTADLQCASPMGAKASAPLLVPGVAADAQVAPMSLFPAEARPVIAEGIKRLTDYQDAAYAQRYVDYMRRFAGRGGADGPFIRELARNLALRMSVEDVIRVAQLKLRDARLERVNRVARASEGDIVDVTEYLKPGPEEIFGLLPPRLGRWAVSCVRPDRAWPLKVTTTRPSGFLRLKLLAALKPWRPRTLRFADEAAWLERWLGLIDRTLAVSPSAALEIVSSAALVRGYGETYLRGRTSWTKIMERVVEPMLAGRLPRSHFADAVLQARLAASKEPDGAVLDDTIAAINRMPVADQAAAE